MYIARVKARSLSKYQTRKGKAVQDDRLRRRFANDNTLPTVVPAASGPSDDAVKMDTATEQSIGFSESACIQEDDDDLEQHFSNDTACIGFLQEPLDAAGHDNDPGDGISLPIDTSAWVFQDEAGQEQQRMTFTEAAMTPTLSAIDIIKTASQDLLGAPVVWWPLEPPRKRCPPGHTRLTWSRTHRALIGTPAALSRPQTHAAPFEFDIPNHHFEDFLRWMSVVFAPAANTPILPTHQPVSSPRAGVIAASSANPSTGNVTSTRVGSSSSSSSGATLPGTSSSTTMQSHQPSDKYLHWCVDPARVGTKLIELDLKNVGDEKLVPTLLKAYRMVRGIRGWMSVTTCSGARLIKVNICLGHNILPPL